ncbi:MAG TPA: type II secretion system protein GspC [Anaeromyxobacteraceae bacterium]|nr:type II secretion system protein GspC [Anaeromyxobacteraceae bacterium]
MLEVFLKKYGWVANLVLLAVAAWLLARTVNTAVGAAIRPTPRVGESSAPVASAAPAFASLDVDRLYPLIGLKPPPVPVKGDEPAAPPPPKTCSDLMAPPVATSLRAQLVAGIVTEKPAWSTAVVIDTTNRQTRSYAIGEEIQGAKLLSVERILDERDSTGRGFRVVAIVCHDGRKEYIDFDTGGGGGAPPPPAPNVGVAPVPPPATAAAPDPDGVKKTADNKYEVKKSLLDGTLSNLNSVATQARIVPSFKNGVANGFKVFSIQPNSFYSAIGVENGDVIQKINGYEINSPDKALEIYQKLREARHVTVDLERNGQVIRKEYNVTGQ